MRPHDLMAFALASITSPNAISPEASHRRAIFACYYSLFHTLAHAGARAFSLGGPAVVQQAARAFKHTEMKTVCERYGSWTPGRRLAAPLNQLVSTEPDARLLNIARTFIKLQETRESADYDMGATLSLQDATEVFQLATQALDDFDAIEHHPSTQAFLTALLMADRWKRGG